jgi:phosphatidylglycerol:prolipoprotein diacylglycerol transferase
MWEGAGVLAAYVHDLKPYIFKVNDWIALRYYGLAYLAGFLAVFWMLRFLARRGLFVLKEEEIGDFVMLAALAGVFAGGRLGYILFYFLPQHGFGALLADPLVVFRVTEGGMASHGGILGVMIVLWIYARRKKVSWTALGDGICIGAPIGLFFGRIANFINGELFGRVTDAAVGIKFPRALFLEPPERQMAAWRAIYGADPGLANVPPGKTLEALCDAVRTKPAVKEAIEPFLTPRHPSQLYEALLEGALLFAILFWVRMRWPKLPHGVITGLFFVLYAGFRIFVEQYREPDAALIGSLTEGQFLSLFMIAIGLGFLVSAFRRNKSPE